jgi:hypothetical protein
VCPRKQIRDCVGSVDRNPRGGCNSAMLTVLETLAPTERAVFVLHEVFEMSYGEIAEAIG